jgi:FMN-dependent NADH-azoreductase
MRLLHVDSSILGGNSVSRTLTAEIVEGERRRTPGLEIVYRDLAADPLPHITGEFLAAGDTTVVDEFLAADIVVIGVPMYNFSVPSQLKAWIDQLAIKGKTFTYSERGPAGLAGGKRVVIASSRGGLYGAETAQAALDHQETYLQAIFGLFGITDIAFIRAEGVNMPEHRHRSIETARAAISGLTSGV